MTSTFARIALLTTCITGPFGCVISGTDDDDDGGGADEGADDTSGGGSDASAGSTNAGSNPTTDAMTTADDDAADDAADDADDDSTDEGGDVTPQRGTWQYQEAGGTTNDCTFIAEPSNGFGQYALALTGAGAFTITPGDETEPFECTFAGSAYACAERLTGMIDEVPGYDASGSILVAIEGTLESATSMTGTQQGRIECAGADCGLAAQALGVTFPCEFMIPFDGTAL